jgi:putative oxidoreductase
MNTLEARDTRPAGLSIPGLVATSIALMERLPHSLVALTARIFPAAVFWQSGRTKVDGFALKDSTFFLFEYEYALPVIDPAVAAYMATIAEHVFPILLIVGFATRYAALSLLIMTATIQIFVYPGAWITHGLWATALLIVIARGPGVLSIDHLIARRYGMGK